jgi:signal transduction histidine kinase
MFQRMHRESEFQGTGMGLAIVRKAVERMNGTVGVESKETKGSRFWVELPVVK